MSDSLKDAALALLGTALLSGLIQHRAEHAIRHDLARTLRGGEIITSVEPSGLLGHLVGRSSVTRIAARGFTADDLPFRQGPGSGARVYVRRLTVDLDDFVMRGVPVRRFHADLPDVTVDMFRALLDERILIRTAKEGTAQVEVDDRAIRAFLSRRYPDLQVESITLAGGRVSIRALRTAGAARSRLELTSRLAARDGRYIDAVEANARIDGRQVPAAFAAGIVQSLNPVLDTERDLGMGEVFRIETVDIADGRAILRGRARVPPAAAR